MGEGIRVGDAIDGLVCNSGRSPKTGTGISVLSVGELTIIESLAPATVGSVSSAALKAPLVPSRSLMCSLSLEMVRSAFSSFPSRVAI